MQKKIIALAIAAAFAAPVTAMAEASLYGTFDVGYRMKNALGANGTSGTSTNSMDMRGLYASNAWGFKGSEDLGDGMKALVQFEADFIPGTATGNGQTATYQGQLFDRQMTGGLSGSFGTVQAGWDYTAAFKINRKFDPMNYNFVTSLYSSAAVIAGRNYLVDYTNKFGDISVNAQYEMDNADTASNTKASVGQGRALAVDYAAGPISAGASYTSRDSSVQTGTNLENPITLVTAGAGFNYGSGVAKVGYAKKTTKAGVIATGAIEGTDTTMWLGANYIVSSKIGATLAYYKNTTNSGAIGGSTDVVKTKLIGMVNYALSKNTTAYVGAERESAETLATATTLTADASVTSSTSVGLAIKF